MARADLRTSILFVIMCGIWAYVISDSFQSGEYASHEESASSSASRGPDRRTDVRAANYHFTFHRLAIHDLTVNGDQPFAFTDDRGTYMTYMCNGEIYNWRELIARYNFKQSSTSDCEVIGHLMQHFNYDIHKVAKELDGEFAIVCRVEHVDGTICVVAARDPYGVRPLYYGTNGRGVIFSSTLAGVSNMGAQGYHVLPGSILQAKLGDVVSTESTPYFKASTADTSNLSLYDKVTATLIDAVRKRLDSERPVGFLLSGGLDSSLVVAIAAKVLGLSNIHTFSIGMSGSVDLKYAKQVAEHLGTKHTEVTFTMEEGLAAIPDVIKVLETYDITTIRASVGQYLLAKHIKEHTNIRVLLNGDGADEVECGYLYFYYAPTSDAAHDECERLLKNIHMYDGLRVDRTIASHGIEARVPFLDPMFVGTYLGIDASMRIPTKERMEKQLIRDAFFTKYPDILPKSVLYRIKNAFSDGVSTKTKPWFQMIKDWVSQSHGMSEADYYRNVFDAMFPNQSHILSTYWMPQWTDASDPSARVLSVFSETQ